MKVTRLALVPIFSLLVFADSSDTRQTTDPRSIRPPANTEAVPVPIDDLFYTRSTFGGTWSPDGKQIVFTTDMTGRFNLWKVNAEGGWPIQLSQSDDLQSGAVF